MVFNIGLVILFTSQTNLIETIMLLLDVYMFQKKRFANVDFVENIYSFHVRRYIILQNSDTCLILVIFSENFSFYSILES